jgi:hypothetical protein
MGGRHQHDKIYAAHFLASFPPQRPWICRTCLTRGADSQQYGHADTTEYDRLERQARAKQGDTQAPPT